MRAGVAIAVVGLMAMAGEASAHHSAAMFDRAKTTVLEGVVKTYTYTMPHSWIDVAVTPPGGGEAVVWGIEGGTPPAMRNQGITPTSLKPGDKVTVRVHPLKDGRPAGSFIDITMNGRVYGNGRPAEGEPASARPAGS